MNHNSEQFANAMGVWTRAVPVTTGRIQGWFHRPDHKQLNLELNLRLEEQRNERRHIAGDAHDSGMGFTSLEQALSSVGDEFTAGGAQLRILVMGQPKALKSAIQEQIYLIVREALANALRYSEATTIEAEVEYQRHQLRVVVRDNGRGLDPRMLHFKADSHWGLLEMHERAKCIGAQLRIWSKRGAGTEVEISVPADIAAPAYVPKSPTLQNEAVA